MGRCQRSRVVRSVGKEEQLKRWVVVSSDRLQWGQEGEGVLLGSDRCGVGRTGVWSSSLSGAGKGRNGRVGEGWIRKWNFLERER